MNEFNNGGAAFPVSGIDLVEDGMTLRDYFAAKALQGILSSEECQHSGSEAYSINVEYNRRWVKRNAKAAYSLADAMIEAGK